MYVTGWLCDKGHFTPEDGRTAEMVRTHARCAQCFAANVRERQRRYRSTAKGLIRDVRRSAKQRGNR